jgi:RimJ/RimL family protein N-acetyltransferase
MHQVYADGVTVEREGTVAELLEELAQRADLGRFWELGVLDGRVVGFVLPGYADPECTMGTNLFIGIVPEARGHGYGTELHLRGMLSCQRAGAKSVLGSCDSGNEPMVRIFTRLGYLLTKHQHQFEWHESDNA